MRELQLGMQTRNVRRWQKFLNCNPNKQQPHLDNDLSLSGYFGAATELATRAFQTAQNLPVTGIVDEPTRSKAYTLGFRMEFELGPEREPNNKADLREFRPYFLVPLLGDDLPKHPTSPGASDKERVCDPQEKETATSQSHFEDAYTRINHWIKQTNSAVSPNVTDIFVFSHGWHRNFYGAVQAYDRMASLIVRLRHRGRLKLPADYRPLFLMLHWNSDPGEDEWVDRSGRRIRASFLENIGKTFEPEHSANLAPVMAPDGTSTPRKPKSYVDFINDFEEMHTLFARTSSPDVAALHDPGLQEAALKLTELLAYYRIKTAPSADEAEKAAVAWACYHDATARQILLDQPPIHQRFVGFTSALGSLIKFVIGSVGLLTVLGTVTSGIVSLLSGKRSTMLQTGWTWIQDKVPFVGNAVRSLSSNASHFWDGWQAVFDALYDNSFWNWGKPVLFWMSVLIAGALLALIPLVWEARQRENDPKLQNASGSGIPLLTFVSWLYLQILCFVPALITFTATYFSGWLIDKFLRRSDSSVPLLFDERFGIRNETVAQGRAMPYLRDLLAGLTMFPAKLLLRASAKDSALARVAEGLRAQIAFFRMQRRGVEAGHDAAAFLAGLFAENPKLPQLSGALSGARIHLVGHSFGGLVVANAVRVLALDEKEGGLQAKFRHGNSERRIFSLTLLQAAMSSSWFHREEKVRRFIQSTLACIYSGYDTANGFMYPLANSARMAAGYAGLHHIGGEGKSEGYEPQPRAQFISLAAPPNLDDEQYRTQAEYPFVPKPNEPRLLNLDGSRLIYHGPVASGGGHGDVFKESVVNLIWAAITQGSQTIPGKTSNDPPPTSPQTLPKLPSSDSPRGAEIVVNPKNLDPVTLKHQTQEEKPTGKP